jgi:hypothetical protein
LSTAEHGCRMQNTVSSSRTLFATGRKLVPPADYILSFKRRLPNIYCRLGICFLLCLTGVLRGEISWSCLLHTFLYISGQKRNVYIYIHAVQNSDNISLGKTL